MTNKAGTADSKTRSITVWCKAKGGVATAEKVKGLSFKCPACDTTIVYIAGEHRIGEHGKTKETMTHELRRVVELD